MNPKSLPDLPLLVHFALSLLPWQLMTLPFYAGLTLGGILTTASHGTGDRVPSVLMEMVS